MDFESVEVYVLILLNIQINYTHSSVSWNMTTYPAIFGSDVMLTCYTFHPLQNSKDCPVRQWSGGADGRGLMYNGFSSNEEKYEEKVDLLTSQFSLIIKNLSPTDINVNYTCSCGFHANTHTLQLDEKHFQYLPDEANASITSYNDTLKIKMQIRKVYPLPNCSVYIENRLEENKVRLNSTKTGLFYRVSFVAEYKLRNEDCNKQPRLQCGFIKEQITFEGNVTSRCPDFSTERSVDENTSHTVERFNKKSSANYEIPLVIAGFLLLVVFGILVVRARKHIKTIIGKMCKMSKEFENPDHETNASLVNTI